MPPPDISISFWSPVWVVVGDCYSPSNSSVSSDEEMWEREEGSCKKPDLGREQLSSSDVLRSEHRKGYERPEDIMNTKLLAGITIAAALLLPLAAQAQDGAAAGATTLRRTGSSR
jgi:hypothetical protein